MSAGDGLRIVVAATFGNPLGTAWVSALQMAGHRVSLLHLDEDTPTAAQLTGWGLDPDLPLVVEGTLPAEDLAARLSVGPDGAPLAVDVVVWWWGKGVLPRIAALRPHLATTAFLHVVDTFPDAASHVTAVREVVLYRRAAADIDAFVHYSEVMRRDVERWIPAAAARPSLCRVEAFPLRAYTPDPPRSTARREGPPRLVYSGRTDLLWTSRRTMAKDRMGPFLRELTRRGVDVTVSDWDTADTGGLHLNRYPRFTNAELLDGTFARHLDTYDVQLVAYADTDAVIRRRTAGGLSTRLASALTSTTPIAVTSRSTFVADLFAADGEPWGLVYDGAADLAAQLLDHDLMAQRRLAMARHHRRHALDATPDQLNDLLDAAIESRARRTSTGIASQVGVKARTRVDSSDAPSPSPRVAAVLAVHNRRELTVECLRRLRDQDLAGAQLDIYLTDDGSTDGTAEAVAQAHPDVTIVPGDGSLFWNGGMRVALQRAQRDDPDFYLLVNDDTLLSDGALATLLRTDAELRARGRPPSIVVAAVEDPDDRRIAYSGRVRRRPSKPMWFHMVQPTDRPEPAETFNANCVLVPREVVRRIGILDEAFTHGMGDYDYGLRARAAGCEVWVAPGVLGQCQTNPGFIPDPHATIWQELRRFSDTKYVPAVEWRVLTHRWGGPAWPLYWLSPYVKLAAGRLRAPGVWPPGRHRPPRPG